MSKRYNVKFKTTEMEKPELLAKVAEVTGKDGNIYLRSIEPSAKGETFYVYDNESEKGVKYKSLNVRVEGADKSARITGLFPAKNGNGLNGFHKETGITYFLFDDNAKQV